MVVASQTWPLAAAGRPGRSVVTFFQSLISCPEEKMGFSLG